MSLIVGQRFGDKLIAQYKADGLYIHTEYQSGRNFPPGAIIISWKEWERFVAWVDLQRKEEALENSRKP